MAAKGSHQEPVEREGDEAAETRELDEGAGNGVPETVGGIGAGGQLRLPSAMPLVAGDAITKPPIPERFRCQDRC